MQPSPMAETVMPEEPSERCGRLFRWVMAVYLGFAPCHKEPGISLLAAPRRDTGWAAPSAAAPASRACLSAPFYLFHRYSAFGRVRLPVWRNPGKRKLSEQALGKHELLCLRRLSRRRMTARDAAEAFFDQHAFAGNSGGGGPRWGPAATRMAERAKGACAARCLFGIL